MRIYRRKKPTVNITKGTSGSLSEGTYYVRGYYFHFIYNFVGRYGTGASSPRPEVQEVVLGPGENSITVSLEYNGGIQSVQDYGSGKIQIESDLHCLDAGDEITISGTTNYDGTYTIQDWIDYNNFTVTATYVSDQTGSWLVTKKPNNATQLLAYLTEEYPFDSDGGYIYGAGQNNMYITSNDTITIESLGGTYGGYVNYAVDCDKLSIDGKYMIEYGSPILEGTETTITDAELNTEFENAGVSAFNEIRTLERSSNPNYWYIGMHIELPNFTRTVDLGTIKFALTVKMPNVTFTNSRIDKIGHNYGDSYNFAKQGGRDFNVENCLIEGVRNRRLSDIIDLEGDNATMTGVCLSNLNYKNGASTSVYNGSDGIGGTRTIENITIYSGKLIMGSLENVIPSFKNINILSNNADFDMRIYGRGSRTEAYGININTLNTDNEFRLASAYSFSPKQDFYCYREKEIEVLDAESNPIEGATITVEQGENTRTCTTDSDGLGTTDTMKEQDCIRIVNSTDYDNTIYYNWTLTVEADGYESYVGKSYIAKDIPEKITLKEAKPILYDTDGNPNVNLDKENIGKNTSIMRV